MAGRRHAAAPGEPQCPAHGCARPAGFATDHEGTGPCRRHASHRPNDQPIPPTTVARPSAEKPPAGPTRDPLARRLTGSRVNPNPDPYAVMRIVLAAGRRAGYPFGEAWAVAAETGLSYMSDRRAAEWWETLTATERAWADAYARRLSRLESLTQST